MNWKNILKDSVQTIRREHHADLFRDSDHYAWWLSQTYHFVAHSTTLLGYALPFLRTEKLKSVFEHHLGEESRHDLLALKDLEKIGKTLSPPCVFTETFYQTQYYRIQFHGGEALLGYILFLENLAVTWGKDIYEELRPVCPEALLFLRVHAEEDISHVARAIALVQSLSPEAQKIVLDSYHCSEMLYLSMLREGKTKKIKNVA